MCSGVVLSSDEETQVEGGHQPEGGCGNAAPLTLNLAVFLVYRGDLSILALGPQILLRDTLWV